MIDSIDIIEKVLIEDLLASATKKLRRRDGEYFRLDGKTAYDNRTASMKKFNDLENKTAQVFLISIKAGGEGIDLMGANRVIIYDPSFNPFDDSQAIHRAYRFGQTRQVHVYHMRTSGTVESKITTRSHEKLLLSKLIADSKNFYDEKLTTGDRSFFTYEEPPTETTPFVPAIEDDESVKQVCEEHSHTIISCERKERSLVDLLSLGTSEVLIVASNDTIANKTIFQLYAGGDATEALVLPTTVVYKWSSEFGSLKSQFTLLAVPSTFYQYNVQQALEEMESCGWKGRRDDARDEVLEQQSEEQRLEPTATLKAIQRV